MAVKAVVVLLTLAAIGNGEQSLTDGYISHERDLDSQYPPIHLVLNNKDGQIYVSAVNRLYQLNKNLESSTLIQVPTGPVNDSDSCLPYGNCPDESTKDKLELKNNFNKVLLMDAERDRLIVCGSVYQGICEARSIHNISDVVVESPCRHKKCSYQESSAISCLTQNCTCVAVITEGPTIGNSALYVATTSVNNVFTNDRNIISVRSLHTDTRENKMFGFAIDDNINRESKLLLPKEDEAKFVALFKYTFATKGLDGFVYFLHRIEGTYKTVISRLCKNKDPYLLSYIEMSLTCDGLSEEQNGLLINAYYQEETGADNASSDSLAEGALYVTVQNATGSSVCRFTIKDLNKAFDETVISCFKYLGKDPSGANEIAISNDLTKCTGSKWMSPDQSLDDEALYFDVDEPRLTYYPEYTIRGGKIRCGAQYLPKRIKRIPPVKASWSFYQAGVVYSALVVDLVDDKVNVAFIGTKGGKIIGLDVNHKFIFNEINVGAPIIGDVTLDKAPSLPVPHLYVMTTDKIYHMKVAVCERHKTCSDCLGANDPYCGWCILDSKCVPKSSSCPSNSWLKPLSKQCIEATVKEPLERSLQQNLTVEVKLLPIVSDANSYQCLFDEKLKSQAYVDESDKELIVCKAPESAVLPRNFEGEDYVNVTLSILYNGNTEIVSTAATFYECRAQGRDINLLQPCQGCLDNRWSDKCSWCVESSACVPAVTGSCLLSATDCPMITSATNESQLLSVGVPTEIILNVDNLPQLAASGMTCSVMIKGAQPVTVGASLLGSSRTQIKCNRQTYKYTSMEAEVPANVSVSWKPNHSIDMKMFNPVSFYNCSVTHSDCSLCVTSKREYSCGWCGSRCVVKQMCDKEWVSDASRCPGPTISSFAPTNGSISGETLVNISGSDMGVRASDVERVTIAGVECEVQENLYQISNKISCLLRSPGSATSGKVSVVVRGLTAESKDNFAIKVPKLEKVLNQEGPVAGGTHITITGENLDIGWKRNVTIGELPCMDAVVLSSTQLGCKTSEAAVPMSNLSVVVWFDGYSVTLPQAFSYIQNPEITSFTTATGVLASFLAGGREITFTGHRLQLIQTAKLTKRRSADDSFNRFTSDCKVENSTRMTCPSPSVSTSFGDGMRRNASNGIFAEATLMLTMDNILLKLENPVTKESAKLKYYPNPAVMDIDPENEHKLRDNGLFDITVLNLNKDAIHKNEITILIGDQLCPVDFIAEDRGNIRCEVPPKPEGEQNVFPVTVQIGYKVWEIGEATYFVQPPPFSGPLKIVLIVIAVLVLVGVALGIFFAVKNRKHYRDNKNDFQIAIENLEMSVRADFRKAFAELSIDMTDLTADIGDVGLPVLSYREYATNMFFPSARYHPCMKAPDPSEMPIPGVQQGFVQFDLLITNKQFLMAFIRTLEQQRGFNHRDKGNVASLITVVLHKKLDYFTEVMKSLVSELVATSVQRNPKLVLRRTESVAERMFSNWLAICLYPYIRDTAGKPLFLLQKAIKHQVSKGALDAITGKTRYTLSDDSLLKEDIPCESLTLFVSQKEMNPDEPIIVKVLSCDSIPQVKEKIMDAVYKRIPFSQRPKAEQLDLEWRHGRSGHLILPDNDLVSEPGSRWRRVMTIKDYKVENNATMALVQRQQGLDDTTNQPANHSIDTSVVAPMLPEDSVKVYHLVKYSDEIEQKRESSILRDKHKHILDLYLLRLINTKGILQNYVDDVFRAILDTNLIPSAVKHFFDFLDELAKTNGIDDQEILHIWKTNSVLGRFWVTILKNPESVFDIDKPESVESSMAVISQTFIDACSVQEHQPTKDSPINKQLYAKEIPTYKKLVQKYYEDVRQLQPISDQDMCAHMTEISRSHDLEFDVHAAHNELWGYVNKYYDEILETLSNDPNVTQMVTQRLKQAYTLIDSTINNP